MPFTSLRKFPFIPSLMRVFIRSGCLIFFQMLFQHLLKWSHIIFFSFSLLIWWITLIDFFEIRIYLPLLWPLGHDIVSFLYVTRFDLLIVRYQFLYLCLSRILVCSVLVMSLCGFNIQVLPLPNELGGILS